MGNDDAAREAPFGVGFDTRYASRVLLLFQNYSRYYYEPEFWLSDNLCTVLQASRCLALSIS
jgi:hypothetical protein